MFLPSSCLYFVFLSFASFLSFRSSRPFLYCFCLSVCLSLSYPFFPSLVYCILVFSIRSFFLLRLLVNRFFETLALPRILSEWCWVIYKSWCCSKTFLPVDDKWIHHIFSPGKSEPCQHPHTSETRWLMGYPLDKLYGRCLKEWEHVVKVILWETSAF